MLIFVKSVRSPASATRRRRAWHSSGVAALKGGKGVAPRSAYVGPVVAGRSHSCAAGWVRGIFRYRTRRQALLVVAAIAVVPGQLYAGHAHAAGALVWVRHLRTSRACERHRARIGHAARRRRTPSGAAGGASSSRSAKRRGRRFDCPRDAAIGRRGYEARICMIVIDLIAGGGSSLASRRRAEDDRRRN